MDRAARQARIKELEKELSYKESQFWEDSPYHDMKIGALRQELAELKDAEADASPFSLKNICKFIESLFGEDK
ncbi:MAG: hypothetical protein CVV41_15500 [Candidatus Riflebacteria bacterium HGW-Riflebacteria-1]|jgi:selenocysteine-specific translation elongation factor|nr:MAG: hypothetical protein CVV41_15500 [Candidatus Riflebacteria bacterium HGW-Riflebacteria-1]